MNYELIDSGEGRRLEKFGEYVLDRPDPEVLWQKTLPASEWQRAHAVFNKIWINKRNVPEKWQMEHGGVKFWCKLTPFKHTGVFPEQAWEWEFIYNKLKVNNSKLKVLNLFAYTGISSLFASTAGAMVTHVDASKPTVTWANENRELNDKSLPIRWIVDDALNFSAREIKRGIKYDAIIMDPPVYGHGPGGKPWDFNKDLPVLMNNCAKLLSDKPAFFMINAYAVSASSTTLANILVGALSGLKGNIDNGELYLKESSAERILSTGIWARWSK